MAEQWEYWWVSVPLGEDNLHKSMGDAVWVRINELGEEGWETVGLVPRVGSVDYLHYPQLTVTQGLLVLLKRRKL